MVRLESDQSAFHAWVPCQEISTIATAYIVRIAKMVSVSQHGVDIAKVNAVFEEPKQVIIRSQHPVHPVKLVVVVAIGIIVALTAG